MLMNDQPIAQIVMVTITNFSFFTWIVLARPFVSRLLNLIECSIEFYLVLISLTHSLFIFMPDYKDEISITVIILVILAILTGSIQIVLILYDKCHRWCEERK